MSRYVPRDLSKIVGAWITPATAAFILHRLNPDAITSLAAAGSVELQERVIKDVERLIEAARFYGDGQRELEPAVSASVTSGECLDEWITVVEAATLIGRTTRAVTSYLIAGQIEGRKKDLKSWEVSRASVEEYMLSRKPNAA